MKLALELFAPEKRMPSGSHSMPEREVSPEIAPDAVPNATTNAEADPAAPRRRARRMIEELDHGRFGGPSFSQQTIELMSAALESAEASLGAPVPDAQLRSIAATLLNVAGDGERDPVRLKAAAMSALGTLASTADEAPPST